MAANTPDALVGWLRLFCLFHPPAVQVHFVGLLSGTIALNIVAYSDAPKYRRLLRSSKVGRCCLFRTALSEPQALAQVHGVGALRVVSCALTLAQVEPVMAWLGFALQDEGGEQVGRTRCGCVVSADAGSSGSCYRLLTPTG